MNAQSMEVVSIGPVLVWVKVTEALATPAHAAEMTWVSPRQIDVKHGNRVIAVIKQTWVMREACVGVDVVLMLGEEGSRQRSALLHDVVRGDFHVSVRHIHRFR